MQTSNSKTVIIGILLLMAISSVFGRGTNTETELSRAYIPSKILTPDTVETRLGTLEFFDGLPLPETADALYEQLDFQRGVRAFLDLIPVASMYAMREGMTEVGCIDGTVGIFETLMDSKSLYLTANSETIYAMSWIDLSDGPVVIESPPNTLGIINNFWFEYVGDLGNAGPDQGQGGKYLLLPPDWDGDIPEGYFPLHSDTFGNFAIWRGFLVDGDPAPGVASMKEHTRIYPLEDAGSPTESAFVNLSGRHFNTIHANDYRFFEEVAAVIHEENVASLDPEITGLLASIGIEKGVPFNPDVRMRAILDDAAAVGNATARAVVFAGRDPRGYIYEDQSWRIGFIGGSHEFMADGVKLLDARTLFYYYATMVTPAMAAKMIGIGSQYAGAFVDSDGHPLDGSRTYRLKVPADVPVADFWSLVAYDNQTRSMLQTDQQFPSVNNQGGAVANSDGTTDIWFGPMPPEGKENNWIQTVPGKGWSVIMRLYGPLEPWFDQSWKLNDIELQDNIPAVEVSKQSYNMLTDVPGGVMTPDRLETRIGTLEYIDGFPTPETIDLVFDNLDFIRGVEAFLTWMPAASAHALKNGFREVGAYNNQSLMITRKLMNSLSLYLTANTESIYLGGWLDLSEGPVVVESPPNTLGMVNDHFFRYVSDMGNAGPDKGQGGKYLYLPPDWEGDIPEGYYVYRSPTYENLIFWRGFLEEGDPAPTVATVEQTLKIYPLGWPELGEEMHFTDITGVVLNTIHANNFEFYREVHQVIRNEPADAFSPELLGILEGIGISKNAYFEPDDHLRKTLEEAVAVGNGIARAISFQPRNQQAYYHEDSAWFTPFAGGNHLFATPSGATDLNARVMFHYPYTAVTPAMAVQMIGVGSQYAIAAVDGDGVYLDGSGNYKLTLPSGIPARDFWSIVIYDPQTRSLLQTPRTLYPGISSESGKVKSNPDGSVTLTFGPDAPEEGESNWLQTVPGKGYFAILRLYGPLESWFDQTWKPGEFEHFE